MTYNLKKRLWMLFNVPIGIPLTLMGVWKSNDYEMKTKLLYTIYTPLMYIVIPIMIITVDSEELE